MGSFQPSDQTCVSCGSSIGRRMFTTESHGKPEMKENACVFLYEQLSGWWSVFYNEGEFGPERTGWRMGAGQGRDTE